MRLPVTFDGVKTPRIWPSAHKRRCQGGQVKTSEDQARSSKATRSILENPRAMPAKMSAHFA